MTVDGSMTGREFTHVPTLSTTMTMVTRTSRAESSNLKLYHNLLPGLELAEAEDWVTEPTFYAFRGGFTGEPVPLYMKPYLCPNHIGYDL